MKLIDHGKFHMFEYAVTGTGPFPIDMLRYDCAWPTDDQGVRAIMATRETEEDLYGKPRKVILRAVRQPTIDHWESFGWKVTEQNYR